MIAENIISKFDIWHDYQDRIGLDKDRFLRFILEKVKSGDIIAYDPIFLDTGTKKRITVKELENETGRVFNPETFFIDVYRLIFIEDWYFDENTLNIQKDVKGLGFVGSKEIEGNWKDKTHFLIFFN